MPSLGGPESVYKKRFSNSAVRKATRVAKLRQCPICERCETEGRITRIDVVHHIRELADHPDGALDLDNLEALCHQCHNRHNEGKWRANEPLCSVIPIG